MSFAWIGAISAVIGAAVSATSAIEQGQAAKETADKNAAKQAADAKMKARRIAATGIAQAGAGGIDPNTGTPLTLTGQTEAFGELDSLRIINNAQRTAWGYQAQAGIDELQGNQARTAGNMNAGATLLGGTSSAAFGYVKATQ